MKDVIVVGAGGMGRAWMDTIDRRSDLRIAAVVDVRVESARDAVAERGGQSPCFDAVEDALAAVDADLLVNVTIPEAHYAVSAAALRARVPVLSEKPATPTVQEALRLTALSEATGTLLAVSQSRRYSTGIQRYRDALAELGGAQQLDAQFFRAPRFGGFRDEMDSPLLVDMAIHTFDQARYLLGEEPLSVFCDEFSPTWSWYDGDASAVALFRFASGQRFTYTGSWCSDGLETSWNGAWRGAAAQGAAAWDGERSVRTQGRDDAEVEIDSGDGVEGLDAALAEFVSALDGGPAPSGEIHSNVWSLAMVEAAVTSAREGRVVLFDDVFAHARAEAVAAALAAGENEVAERLTA